jgi:hypothetical protein
MDATAKKLVEKMRDIQKQIGALQRQSYALSSALEAIGMRIEDDDPFSESSDERYAKETPFAHTSLVETCKKILTDHMGKEMTKNQVEYLAAVGGYRFNAEDSVNSVAVTLQRLAESEFCEVDRQRGPEGNKYRFSTNGSPSEVLEKLRKE